MKFLVLCVYELGESSEDERRAASRVLESAGFHLAGFEESPDDTGALQMAVVGEFRAPSAAALRDRVQNDLYLRLVGRGLQPSISLCIRPSPFADDSARVDIAV